MPGIAGAPVADERSVIVATHADHVAAYEWRSGTLRWTVWLDAGPSALATVPDTLGAVFIGKESGVVEMVRKDDGVSCWATEVSEGSALRSMLPIGRYALVVAHRHGITNLDQRTGEVFWRLSTPGDWPSMSLQGAHLLVRDGAESVMLVDSHGGVIRKVNCRLGSASTRLGTPVAGDPVLVVSTDIQTGTYEMVALDPSSLVERWSLGSDGSIGRPVLVADTVYVTGERSVMALSADNGTTLWSCDYARLTCTALAVADGRLFTAGTRFDPGMEAEGVSYLVAF